MRGALFCGIIVHSRESIRVTFGNIAVRSPRDRVWWTMARAAKLAFDLLAASTIILTLSPLLLTIAFLIKLDGGPVFYSHRRAGPFSSAVAGWT